MDETNRCTLQSTRMGEALGMEYGCTNAHTLQPARTDRSTRYGVWTYERTYVAASVHGEENYSVQSRMQSSYGVGEEEYDNVNTRM